MNIIKEIIYFYLAVDKALESKFNYALFNYRVVGNKII